MLFIGLQVFNTTYNKIAAISWQSVLLTGNQKKVEKACNNLQVSNILETYQIVIKNALPQDGVKFTYLKDDRHRQIQLQYNHGYRGPNQHDRIWMQTNMRDYPILHSDTNYIKGTVLLLLLNISGAIVVVTVWQLDLQLPVQSVPITINIVSSNSVNDEVYSIQHYVIKFVSDQRQFGCFLRFPPPLKLNATIKLKYC